MTRLRTGCSRGLSVGVVLIFLTTPLLGQSNQSRPVDTADFDSAVQMLAANEVSDAVEALEAWLETATPAPDQLLVVADAYGRATDEASIFRKRGLAKKHKETLEWALRIDPTHVEARSELADFLYYAPGIAGGNKGEAEEHLVILGGVSEVAEHRARARHALSAEDFPAAARYLTLVTSTDPHSSAELFRLGVVLTRLDRYDDAMATLLRAVDADPNNARAHYQIGRLAAALGLELERGAQSLMRYLEIAAPGDQPEPKHAHWRLGQVHVLLGNTDEARTHFETALEFDPDFDDAREALAELPGPGPP